MRNIYCRYFFVIIKSFEMARTKLTARKTMGGAMVGESKSACLVIPTLNINCEWDQCDPSTHLRLRALPQQLPAKIPFFAGDNDV